MEGICVAYIQRSTVSEAHPRSLLSTLVVNEGKRLNTAKEHCHTVDSIPLT